MPDKLLRAAYFPSFLEGLSLRHANGRHVNQREGNFPSFLEGLSLRRQARLRVEPRVDISLPIWKGFH